MTELAPLAAKVWRYCEDRRTLRKTVTLKSKYADFQMITSAFIFASRAGSGPVLIKRLARIFPTWSEPARCIATEARNPGY